MNSRRSSRSFSDGLSAPSTAALGATADRDFSSFRGGGGTLGAKDVADCDLACALAVTACTATGFGVEALFTGRAGLVVGTTVDAGCGVGFFAAGGAVLNVGATFCMTSFLTLLPFGAVDLTDEVDEVTEDEPEFEPLGCCC